MGVEFAPAAFGTHAHRWEIYPDYKDSGVKWIGEIPVDWEVKKLKHIAKVNLSNVDKKTYGDQDSVKLCNYVDVYYNDYITYNLSFMEATASFNQIDKFVLRAGDVIITKDSESWEDIAIPAYVPADLNDVICGYHLAHIRPDYANINGEYLFRSFCATRLNNQFRVEAHGITRFGLGKYWIDNSLFPVPPINEQKSIAAFLDRKTAHIDTLISKKERLITLLQEKRAALISHTVTKGLDPDVPMKDSGVEWLGEIPAHWVSVAIKRLLEVKDGTHDTPQFVSPSDNTFQLITSKDIKDGQLVFEEAKHISQDDYETIIKRSNVMTNDIIMPMIGTIGNPVVVGDYNLFAIKNVALFKTCIGNLNSRYLCYFLVSNACQTQFKLLYRGGVQDFISLSVLRNLKVFRMDNDEDHLIANYLDNKTSKIDALIAKIHKAIEKLQEYRTALISAAVTGKIDVRNENRN